MKNILLIGLGRFGRHLAVELNELGHEVMAVDDDEDRVNEILPYVTNAQIGDSTNANFLKSLGIGNFDICFVTISANFENSLETTSLLKELGAKIVISRAERDTRQTTFWIIWKLTHPTQFSRRKCRRSGLERQSESWMSEENIISISLQ